MKLVMTVTYRYRIIRKNRTSLAFPDGSLKRIADILTLEEQPKFRQLMGGDHIDIFFFKRKTLKLFNCSVLFKKCEPMNAQFLLIKISLESSSLKKKYEE